MVTNPYKILDIPETATDEEVKSAYRKLAKSIILISMLILL